MRKEREVIISGVNTLAIGLVLKNSRNSYYIRETRHFLLKTEGAESGLSCKMAVAKSCFVLIQQQLDVEMDHEMLHQNS